MEQIIADICDGKPISAARFDENGTIFCTTIHDKKKIMVRVALRDVHGIFIGNTYHTPIQLVANERLQYTHELGQFTFVLLLPNRDESTNQNNEYYYYCTTDKWTERSKERSSNQIKYILPLINDAAY